MQKKATWGVWFCLSLGLAVNQVFAAFPGHGAPEIRVRIFSKYHPKEVKLFDGAAITEESVLPKEYPARKVYSVTVPGAPTRNYFGSLWIDRLPKSKELLLVVKVDLEDYARSVALSEIGSQNFEAMKVQMILARSVALAKLRMRSSYDVDDMTGTQVYHGEVKHGDRKQGGMPLDPELEAARGLVVTYHHRPVETLYTAACGHQVYSANEVWGNKIDFLTGQERPALALPIEAWEREITRQQLENIFSLPKETSPLVFVREQKSTGQWGVRLGHQWRGIEEFRLTVNRKLGWNFIRSTEFKMTANEGSGWLLRGYGWGHLVGLCQREAIELTKRGWKAPRLIQYFYPGTEIEKIY